MATPARRRSVAPNEGRDAADASPRRSSVYGAALVALCCLSLAYGGYGAFVLDAGREGTILWDLRFYQLAAERWQEGLDPYLADSSPTGYYYSLAVTPLLSRLFASFRGERLYWLIAVSAIALTLSLAVRAAGPPSGLCLLCWLYALGFGSAEALYVLASGNLAWLAALLQATALLAAVRGRWRWFYLLVGVASLIKPYSLALLIVPLALRAFSLWGLIAAVPLLTDAVLSAQLHPELVSSRARAIWLGVIEPLQLRYSLAGRLSRLLADLGLEPGPATAAAVLTQLAVAAMLLLAVRARTRHLRLTRGLPLAVLAAFATVPRMAGYDAFVFAPFFFVALVALWSHAPAARSKAGRAATALALFAGLLKAGLAVLPVLTYLAVVLGLPRSGLESGKTAGA